MIQQAAYPSSSRLRYDEFRAYGGCAEMMASTAPEILFEGPANTGKTRAVLEKCYMLCNHFPMIRMLWVRKTRKSLSESVLTTWEERVLPPGHPCITGTASKSTREKYTWPNGSVIVLGGMDNPDRIMSTEYDVIVYFEATEGRADEWEKLSTRARNKRIETGVRREDGSMVYFHQMIADCNPGAEFHWLNRRAGDGSMQRIRTLHKDNPTFDEDDQRRLDKLTGVRRQRLRDGLWVSEEGQVWDNWVPAEMTCMRRDLLWDKDEPEAGTICQWFFGSMDFGHRKPGTLQVWGVDGDDRMFLVHEVYKKRKSIEWWAEALETALDKWDVQTVVADPSRPELIEYFNDRLGEAGGREEDRLVVPADNDRGQGIELVRDGFDDGRIFICRDALEEGECELSKEEYKPTCLEEEIPAYVWKETKEGMEQKEETDPRCEDHGCDAMRYAAMYKWPRDLALDDSRKMFAPGTWGDVLGHQEVWDRIYTKRPEEDEISEEDFGYDPEWSI